MKHGERLVFLDHRGIMIRMVDFHGHEAGSRKRRHQRVKPQLARMRQRRNAAGSSENPDDLAWCRSPPRDKRRPSGCEVQIKRFLNIGNMPARDERTGDFGPAKRLPGLLGGLRQNAFAVDVHIQFDQPIEYFDHAPYAVRALTREELRELRVVVVEKIAKDMDIEPVVDRGNLDARDNPKPERRGSRARSRYAGDRVVISHRDDRKTRAMGPLDELLWCGSAV